jgi:hypothetical protein
MISVIDMAHTRLADTDRRFFAVLGESGKISEFVYPQVCDVMQQGAVAAAL